MARLYRRGRVWWTWFYDERGKRQRASTKCRDKRAAELVARRLERSAAAPTHAAEDQTTLRQACEHFRVDRRNRGRSPDTLRYYEPKLGHLLRLLGDDTPLDDIDAGAVDDLIAVRLEEGASRHTVAKELGALGGVLRVARRRGEYRLDPRAVLPEGWSSGYTPRRRSLTHKEAKALLLALRPDRAAHIAFIIACGARLGESERARRADIDLAAWRVRIRGSKTTASRRSIPIPKHAADLLRQAHRGAATSGPAFARWGNIRRDLAVACKRAGIEPCTPNDLRRTASTWLVELGVPSNVVAHFLGQTTSRMVELVYGRVDGDQLERALASVGVTTASQQRAKRAGKRGKVH